MIGLLLLLLGGCLARTPQGVHPLAASDEVLEVTIQATAAPCEVRDARGPDVPVGQDALLDSSELPDGEALPGCSPGVDAPLRTVGVAGSLTRAVVLEAVLANLAPVRACVEDTLPLAPREPGQVVVRLSVTPEGRVSRSSVASDTTAGDGRLAQCLAGALARTVFPPAEGPTWICWPVNVQVR